MTRCGVYWSHEALLDEIHDQGGSITVTKRGRPVATVVPARNRPWKSTKGILTGKVKIVGDIVNFNTADSWDVVRETQTNSSKL